MPDKHALYRHLVVVARQSAWLPWGEHQEFGAVTGTAIAIGAGLEAVQGVVTRLISMNSAQEPLDTLTPRERDVLSLMAQGHTNAGIARRLFLSQRTVETHIASLLAKLGIEPATHGHRRVLAVLTFLNAQT